MAYLSNKVRILNALRGRKRGYTARDLSDKLGISTETVYSTVSTLRRAGYEIAGSKNKKGVNTYVLSL